ncbi:MAG: VOC family protein [Planctomycetota bacterium]
MQIRSICGIIITTENLDKMVHFYQDILGLPLEPEEHGDLELHYGADLGAMHFAIHPLANFQEMQTGNASTKIAFEVDSLDAYLEALGEEGYSLEEKVINKGFGPTVSFQDPDGNWIELVELRHEWDES